MTRFELGIIMGHHQRLVDPELDVRTDCPDAVAEPFPVFGQQSRGFPSRLARLPEPTRVGLPAVAYLGFLAAGEVVHIIRRWIGPEIEPAVARGPLIGDAEHPFYLKIRADGISVNVSHPADADQNAILDGPFCFPVNRPSAEVFAIEQRDPIRGFPALGSQANHHRHSQ